MSSREAERLDDTPNSVTDLFGDRAGHHDGHRVVGRTQIHQKGKAPRFPASAPRALRDPFCGSGPG